MIKDDEGVSVRRVFNVWAEKISVIKLSVGQENEFTYTFGFTVFRTHDGGGCCRKIGRGMVESSRLVGGTYSRRALDIFSGILVVPGKYLYCFFRVKEESSTMMKFNVAIEFMHQ